MERRRHLDREHEKHRLCIRKIVIAIIIAAAIVISALFFWMLAQTPEPKTYVYDTFYYDENNGVYYAYISELYTASNKEQ